MALIPGTRIGVYEVTAQIGAGGMGEVYRATDSNLKRQVAIKVLPASVAGDADRLARFQREAEVLAALNHPNIAAIYGLEQGPAEAGHHIGTDVASGLSRTIALVMELVEGDDLSQRIARLRAPGASARQAGMPLDEALPIAKQIAEALEAAHEQGIIHRDLKPANIKVRADGTVKVLDFGLAKAIDQASSPKPQAMEATQSPTITSPAMTQAGMILGTAAYMSPEQARGKAVDKRADIWAFGAVLFEMLTGQRAFGGEDLTVTLARVVEREPDFDALPSSVPPRVGQVLRLCLRKDPKQRVGDIRDVRLALEGAFETAIAQTTSTTTSSASQGRLVWMAAFAAALLGTIGLAVPTVRHLRETPLPEARVDIVTPATDDPASFALSPDGQHIVFAATGDGGSRLWLRSLATTTAQPLAGTEGGAYPFWSPNGSSIGFFAGNALKRIDLGGSVSQTLAQVLSGRGATWNADGVILFAPDTTSPVMRVAATGGAATAVTTLGPQQLGHLAPHFLPDGRRFLFYAAGAPDTAGIYLGALDGSAATRLTPGGNLRSSSVYLPAEASGEGGWLLWVRAGTLVAQHLDLDRKALTGDPIHVADSVGAVSASAAGLVAYRTGTASERQLTWMDRSGTSRGTVGDTDGTLQHPRVFPDGRRVAVSRGSQGSPDIWLLDGTRGSRLTFDAAHDSYPVLSPDGTRVAFHSTRSGQFDLYQKLTSGASTEERLVASDQAKIPGSWSADGRFLLYYSIDPQTSTDLWIVPMVGTHTPSVFLKTPFNERWGAFSPDGQWVAYMSNESGRMEIYVRPFIPPSRDAATFASAAADKSADRTAGTAGGQWQVSTAGGIHPVWRPDGKELYYLNPAGAMMAAPIVVTGATIEPGAPVLLFPTRVYGGGVDAQQGRQYDVARDGRFLVNTVLDSAAAPITLLMNWHPEAKK